jgi:hypothetical protein
MEDSTGWEFLNSWTALFFPHIFRLPNPHAYYAILFGNETLSWRRK